MVGVVQIFCCPLSPLLLFTISILLFYLILSFIFSVSSSAYLVSSIIFHIPCLLLNVRCIFFFSSVFCRLLAVFYLPYCTLSNVLWCFFFVNCRLILLAFLYWMSYLYCLEQHLLLFSLMSCLFLYHLLTDKWGRYLTYRIQYMAVRNTWRNAFLR